MAEYDVVLSYAVEDAGWVEKLAEGLSNEGIRVLNDPPGAAPSHQLKRWLSGDLSQDGKLIVVCSPHYFRDSEVRGLLETFSRQYANQLKLQRPLVPVLPPGSQFLPAVDGLPSIDFSNEEDFELRLRQLLEALDITQLEAPVKNNLKALLRWVGLERPAQEKPAQEFRELIAELYRLFGFDVKIGHQIKDVKADLWVEKRSGGIAFQTMIECIENPPTSRQIESLAEKYRALRNHHPSVVCMIVTTQELSDNALGQIGKSGIRVTTYAELLRSLVPLDQYAEKLIADAEKWRGEHWQGQDWFIRPNVQTDYVRKDHRAWQQISAWLGGKRGNLLAMLGDLGTGKSTPRFVSGL